MSNDLILAQIKNLRRGQHKRPCPSCQDTRKTNRKDRPLSVKVDADGVQYHCHHCGENGYLLSSTPKQQYYEPVRFQEPIVVSKASNSESRVSATSFLEDRGIARQVMDDHAILGDWVFAGERKPAIGFPYRDNQGQVVSIKWRSANGTKQFSQQGVCEDFFNVENYQSGNDLLICEGELDALSWMTAGLPDKSQRRQD